MRQGSSARRSHHLQVVNVAVVARRQSAKTWPAWASLLLVLGAGFAAWTAIILTASTFAG
jgi:hypothetical protein